MLYVSDIFDLWDAIIDMLNDIIGGLKIWMIPHTSISMWQLLIFGLLISLAFSFFPILEKFGRAVKSGSSKTVQYVDKAKRKENKKIARNFSNGRKRSYL